MPAIKSVNIPRPYGGGFQEPSSAETSSEPGTTRLVYSSLNIGATSRPPTGGRSHVAVSTEASCLLRVCTRIAGGDYTRKIRQVNCFYACQSHVEALGLDSNSSPSLRKGNPWSVQLKNLVDDCEEPLLVFEQISMSVPSNPGEMSRRLLQMNRCIVQGAFALDEEGTRVLYRKTLQLAHLDPNEVEWTIEA